MFLHLSLPISNSILTLCSAYLPIHLYSFFDRESGKAIVSFVHRITADHSESNNLEFFTKATNCGLSCTYLGTNREYVKHIYKSALIGFSLRRKLQNEFIPNNSEAFPSFVLFLLSSNRTFCTTLGTKMWMMAVRRRMLTLLMYISTYYISVN